jgi:hypothetical protein
MRIAVSGNDGFIAPHFLKMLGDVASEIPSEALDNPRLLDGALASCACLIHFNGHPPLFIEAHTDDDLSTQSAVLSPLGYTRTGRVWNASPTYEWTHSGK